MDVVLKDVDGYFLEPYVYSHFPSFQEPSFLRNTIGLYLILSVGGWLMYFIFAALSYIIIYDKEQEKRPQILKEPKEHRDQVGFGLYPTHGNPNPADSPLGGGGLFKALR